MRRVAEDETTWQTGPADSVDGAARVTATAKVGIDALYRAHYLALVRLAVQLVDDVESAEDVVQDVFAALHRRGDLTALDDPKRYLTSAVVNRARSALRRRRVARAFRPAREQPVEAADASSLRAAERARVLAALGRLPRRQREVVVLRYYADLPVREVAAVLRIAPSAVSSSLSRALTSLTKHLEASL